MHSCIVLYYFLKRKDACVDVRDYLHVYHLMGIHHCEYSITTVSAIPCCGNLHIKLNRVKMCFS